MPVPSVTAPLNYLAPTPQALHTIAFDPPDGAPRFNGRLVEHPMSIHDARHSRAGSTLATTGFALCPHRSEVRDSWDEALLREIAYPEQRRARRGLLEERQAVARSRLARFVA